MLEGHKAGQLTREVSNTNWLAREEVSVDSLLNEATVLAGSQSDSSAVPARQVAVLGVGQERVTDGVLRAHRDSVKGTVKHVHQ